MKSNVPKTIVTKLLAAVVLLLVCASSIDAQRIARIENDLIGSWALDYNTSISRIDASSKAHFDTISHTTRNRLADSFRQRKMTFQKDGLFILKIRNGREVKGTWKVESNGSTLKIMLGQREIVQEIEEINRTRLVIHLGTESSKSALFERWYLTRSSS